MVLNNDWLNNRIILDVRTYVFIISLKTQTKRVTVFKLQSMF